MTKSQPDIARRKDLHHPTVLLWFGIAVSALLLLCIVPASWLMHEELWLHIAIEKRHFQTAEQIRSLDESRHRALERFLAGGDTLALWSYKTKTRELKLVLILPTARRLSEAERTLRSQLRLLYDQLVAAEDSILSAAIAGGNRLALSRLNEPPYSHRHNRFHACLSDFRDLKNYEWSTFLKTHSEVFAWILRGSVIGLVLLGAMWVYVTERLRRLWLEQRAAETTLREREEQHRRLLETLPSALLTVQDDRILFANPAAAALCGFGAPADLLGMDAEIVFPHWAEAGFGAFKNLASADGFGTSWQTVIRRAGQDELPVEVFIRPTLLYGRPALQLIAVDISEHRRTEAALREGEKRFRMLADTVPVLIWMAGEGRHTFYFNSTWFRFTGRTRGQEYGTGWTRGVHPDDLPHCLETYERAFRARLPYSTQFRLRHADGTYHWVADTGVPRFTPDGMFAGYVGSAVDISDRIHAEEVLRESENRLRTLYDNTPALLHTLDSQGRIVHVSNFWLETLGYTRDEVLGRRITDFLSEASRRYVQEIVLPDFYGSGQCRDVPFQLVTKNGDLLDVLASGTGEREADGTIVRSLFVLTDVTQHNADERALRQSERRYRLLANNSRDIIWAADCEGRFTYVSPAVRTMLGYEPEELIGSTVEKLLTPEQWEEARREFQTILAAADRPSLEPELPPTEMPVHRKDGSVVWVEVVRGALHDEQGRIIGVQGVVRDITERRRARAELASQADELRRSNQVLERFAQAATLDLAEPLSLISCYAATLEAEYRERLDANAHELLHFIAEGAEKLRSRLRNLLATSLAASPEKGAGSENPSPMTTH